MLNPYPKKGRGHLPSSPGQRIQPAMEPEWLQDTFLCHLREASRLLPVALCPWLALLCPGVRGGGLWFFSD